SYRRRAALRCYGSICERPGRQPLDECRSPGTPRRSSSPSIGSLSAAPSAARCTGRALVLNRSGWRACAGALAEAKRPLPPLSLISSRLDIRGIESALDDALDKAPYRGHEEIPDRCDDQKLQLTKDRIADGTLRAE